MGRPAIDIDSDVLYDLLEGGLSQKDAAGELGISIPTLSRKIAKIQEEQSILLQYRTLQSLELTGLQSRILEAITPEKIEGASLRDLVLAFKILKEKEHLIEGKPSEIKGLVGYLVEMERQEIALKKGTGELPSRPSQEDDILEGEFEDESFEERERESTDEDENLPAL